MNRTIILSGVIFGMLAVIFGAFGAHGLKSLLTESDLQSLFTESNLQSFETGVRYQMYHAILLIIIGGIVKIPSHLKRWLLYFFTIGIVLFSFSIYLLATNSLTAFDFKSIAFVTPIGGAFLIAGWALFGYRVVKNLI